MMVYPTEYPINSGVSNKYVYYYDALATSTPTTKKVKNNHSHDAFEGPRVRTCVPSQALEPVILPEMNYKEYA